MDEPMERREWLAMVAMIALIFLVSRIAILAAAAAVASQLPTTPVQQDGVLSLLCRWDCGWYMNIAQNGYSTNESPSQPGATNFAFFPLYPSLVRLATPLFAGNMLLAAVSISNLCFLAALLYVFRYVRLLGFDHSVALLSVSLLCFLPQSYVFSAGMSESTFLLLLVMATYYLRKEHYLAAGIAAALLSATRAPGIIFALFALTWLVGQHGWRSVIAPWTAPDRLVPLMLAPIGLFLFWGYCFIATNDAFAQSSTARHGWEWSFVPPWNNLVLLLRSGGAVTLMAIGGIFILFCSAMLSRMRLVAEAILCLAALLLVMSGEGATSVFRYWIVLFPAWIAVARIIATRPLVRAGAFLLAGLSNGMMLYAWTLQEPLAF